MSERRFFSRVDERVALWLAAGGRCEECGIDLEPGWHADHSIPWSRGGITDVVNGRALCPPCNLRKGSIMPVPMRQWQRKALEEYRVRSMRDYVAHVCPAAGKTRWALEVAKLLRSQGLIERIVVVVPSSALRVQWADAAHTLGIDLDPVMTNASGSERRGSLGPVVTYHQVNEQKSLHRKHCAAPTLVIFDEIHHAADQLSWGDSIAEAFEPAARRLLLTGTLFRSRPEQRIPFVEYDNDGIAVAHTSYSYGTAIGDGVCRTIEFLAYDGQVSWIDGSRSSSPITTHLGADLALDDVSIALSSAYQPGGNYMREMITLANERLMSQRTEVPDAAGLIIASTQEEARQYGRLVTSVSGSTPVVVVSDDPDASRNIDDFARSTVPWIVAVSMVSEGVDIPRLTVGVWATRIRTELYFRQIVGRFVRQRDDETHNAALFIPALQPLLGYAEAVEAERLHALEESEIDLAKDRQERQDSQIEFSFRVPLEPGHAEFARHIMSGESAQAEYTAGEDFCRATGVPFQYARQVGRYLSDLGQVGGSEVHATLQPPPDPEPMHRRVKHLRAEVTRLARRYAFESKDDYKEVFGRLARETGQFVSKANLDGLEWQHELVVQWLADL